MGSAAEVSMSVVCLPPRPPTPPRGAKREPESNLLQVLIRHPTDPRRSLSTPPNVYSPSSSSQGSGSRRKRVEFSAQAEYKEPPVFIDGNSARQNPTPVSVPPPNSSRPVKSILKVANCSNPLDPSSGINLDSQPMNAANIVTMLDSTVQQLAGADRAMKLDAYLMMVRALKASNNLPDRIALQNKMGLFMQFIQRDMTSKTEAGSADSTLINHALNLLSTFLHFPGIASTLSNEFGIYVIDHCIRAFESGGPPKDVVKHLMHVVALQKFSHKVMTSERVGKLVTVLHNIEEHMQGKSIIVSRIRIYRTLVKQCKQTMLLHTDWLHDLFTDMLSSMKEIRSPAISLGLDVAFSLGKEKQISRKVKEIFQLAPEEESYIDYFTKRLRAMAKDKTQVQWVPQIWSVVILLIPGVDKWDHFNEWLRILQDCFNESEYHVKLEANRAWNRLVYGQHLDERAFMRTTTRLSQPLVSQWKRKGTPKATEELHKIVLGGVCNLFYYAFRPATSLSNLDLLWDSIVKPIMRRLTSGQPTKECLDHAGTILTGLFDCSTPRLWKEDRVATNAFIKPEELPSVDSKWLRRNASRVFSSVEPILEKNFLELSLPESATHTLWKTLIGAVASAAAKEVKVSMDTAAFVGHVLGLVLRTWTRGIQPRSGEEAENNDSAQFLASMRVLIGVMVESMGILPFTEKQLSRGPENVFTPLSTPSHRNGKGHGVCRSSLHHLFPVLSTLPPGIPDDTAFTGFLDAIFAPFFAAKSERGRADMALEMLQIIPMETLCPYGPWQLVATRISAGFDPLQNSHRTASSSSDTPLGNEFREIVRVLERGLRSVPNLPSSHWQRLYHSVSERVRDETGDAGLAICVVEPLARVILELHHGTPRMSSLWHVASVELLSFATPPKDRQAIDAARRRLWGTASAGSRSASFDPFEKLYALVNANLEYSYDNLASQGLEKFAVVFLGEVAEFFARNGDDMFVKALALVQDGLACWVRDEKMQLDSRESSAVAEATKHLWDRISSRLGGIDRPERLPLNAIEGLLCAAFESKHRHVVNTVSIMWNRVFDHVDDISYPDRLKAVLLSRRSLVDLALPGLELSSLESGAQQPAFIDSQVDMNVLNTTSTNTDQRRISRPSSSAHSPLPIKLVVDEENGRSDREPPSSPAKFATRGSTPRFRHDDSQIHFAAIDSSPLPEAAAESQVLTEHQREVRERQRESGALFSEFRSSPGATSRSPAQRGSSPHASPQKLPEHQRAITPDAEAGFDDFVASTPTPRRGQALPMAENDHDMIDPPSSPPEPRRYPLLEEIASRSNAIASLEEWQFSSSPISGSPRVTQYAAPVQPPALDIAEVLYEELPLDYHVAEPLALSHQVSSSIMSSNTGDTEEIPVVANELDMQEEQTPVKSMPPPDMPRSAAPSTPTRRLRSMHPHETPKSDQDEFVDALTSPLPPTPQTRRTSTRGNKAVLASNAATSAGVQANTSFVASDIDETSMLRLMDELDARNSASSLATSSAPPRDMTEPPVLDCIIVKAQPIRTQARVQKPKSRSSTISLTPEGESVSNAPQETNRPSRRTRKRNLSALDDTVGKGSNKRRISEPDIGVVPDSQESKAPDAPLVGEDANQDDVDRVESSQESSRQSSAASPSSVLDPDVMDVDGDGSENELQSQISNETQARNRMEDEKEAESEFKATDGSAAVEPAGDESENVEKQGSAVEAVAEDSASVGAGGDGKPVKSVEDIMGLLRGGLEALRTVALARGEVYQLEDMCMDIKRELYEAERRGRDLK